jgi:hypothetical protein
MSQRILSNAHAPLEHCPAGQLAGLFHGLVEFNDAIPPPHAADPAGRGAADRGVGLAAILGTPGQCVSRSPKTTRRTGANLPCDGPAESVARPAACPIGLPMFRFTIRDVLWLTVVVAMGVGWCMEYEKRGPANVKLQKENAELIQQRDSLKWQLKSATKILANKGITLESNDRSVHFRSGDWSGGIAKTRPSVGSSATSADEYRRLIENNP